MIAVATLPAKPLLLASVPRLHVCVAVKKKYRFATDLIFEAKEEKQIRK